MAADTTTMAGAATVSVPLGDADAVEFRGGNLHLSRERPYSSSQSSASSKSVVSQNPNIVTSVYTANNLFSFKEGAVDNAVKVCKTEVIKGDLDGTVEGTWLLTEIDHWDMEKERLVLLMNKSILIVHFDFIRMVVNSFRRILLHTVNRIQIGDLVYPPASLMPPRHHGGVRVYWGALEPSFLQRWNPMCDDLGYVTLSHHLLAYKPGEHETSMYDAGEFIDSAVAAANKVRGGSQVNCENGPITIESYGSVMSMIFNQSHIGFNLARGGVCY